MDNRYINKNTIPKETLERLAKEINSNELLRKAFEQLYINIMKGLKELKQSEIIEDLEYQEEHKEEIKKKSRQNSIHGRKNFWD